tara:strand:+ start:302 stop:1222 length:921 start_codon:yes stop_codon:yes gene_type:complete
LGQKFISKKKKTQNLNSSNNQQGKSISKFDTQSDNLENYQDMADSSLKVSQLQKLQDTANVNPIQLQPEDNLNDQENNPEWNKLSKVKRRVLLNEFINGKISPVLATYLKREGREAELPTPEDLLGTETVQTHLNQFRIAEGGGSRFDTPENFEKMKIQWGLGKEGGGFIATNTESIAAQNEAEKKVTDQEVADGKLPGLWSLASDLGVPFEYWIDKSLGGDQNNPNHEMIRTDIPDPDKFDLAMVRGTEMSAYQKEWLAGGKTLGGKNEAKIKKMNPVKFIIEIFNKNVIPNEVKFEETPKKKKN